MESGNSGGSMQSSSGGDEEYDSRGESISAFFNGHGQLGSLANSHHHQPPPPPADHHPHQHPSMFDPLSNYFDPLSAASSSSRSVPPAGAAAMGNTNNSLLNLEMMWSKNLRSDDLAGFMPSNSSSTQQFFAQPRPGNFPASLQIPPPQETGARPSGSASNEVVNNPNNNNPMARNPKKRSRASRRAPTTVLTTDTTNFRAMVQEFTGIPAPPFTSSPFPRSRLDLFGNSSSLRSVSSSHLDPAPPPYLLRPFAQKLQPPSAPSPPLPFSAASSMVDAIASTATAGTTNINTTAAAATTSNSSTSINYQLASDHLGLLKPPPPPPQNPLNINLTNQTQNPILNFHPLLQPKYPSVFGGSAAKPSDSHLKMGVFEDFGMSHGHHVSTNLSSIQTSNPAAANWGGGDGNGEGSDTHHHHHHHPHQQQHQHQDLLRSINGNYSNNPTQQQHQQQRTAAAAATNGKPVNFSASSSDFHGDKGQETARTEGMMESWICSSD